MTQHALLSASGAHKWLVCTASARLEAEFPDTTSEFAREGTLAHSIAELKLRRYAIEPMSPATFTRRMNKLKKIPYIKKKWMAIRRNIWIALSRSCWLMTQSPT